MIDGGGEPWWKTYRELKDQLGKRTGVCDRSKWQKEFARLNTDRLELARRSRDGWRTASCGRRSSRSSTARTCSITDVTIKNPPFWTINPVYCDNVTIRGVTIDNPDGFAQHRRHQPRVVPQRAHLRLPHQHAATTASRSSRAATNRGDGSGVRPRTSPSPTARCCAATAACPSAARWPAACGSVAVSNCVFDGTDRGIRIKSTRGRGGVVEDVQVSNIVRARISSTRR